MFFALFVVASVATTLVALTSSRIGGPTAGNLILLIRVFAIHLPFFVVLNTPSFGKIQAIRLVHLFMWSGTIACLIGAILYVLNIKMRDAQQMNWYGLGYEASARAGGLVGNSSDFGHLSAILGTVTLCYAVLYRTRILPAMLVLSVSAYSTFISSSRAGALHLVIAGILVMLIVLRGRRFAISLLLLPLAAFALVAPLSSVQLSYQASFALRRLDIFNISGHSMFFSAQERLVTWTDLWDLVREHIFTGIGYSMTVQTVGGAGDNSFLTILVETGIVAGLAYMLFWLSLVVASWRAPSRRLRLVGLSLVLSEISQMLTVDTHRMWTTTPLALLFIGCALRLSEADSDEPCLEEQTETSFRARPTCGEYASVARPQSLGG